MVSYFPKSSKQILGWPHVFMTLKYKTATNVSCLNLQTLLILQILSDDNSTIYRRVKIRLDSYISTTC